MTKTWNADGLNWRQKPQSICSEKAGPKGQRHTLPRTELLVSSEGGNSGITNRIIILDPAGKDTKCLKFFLTFQLLPTPPHLV